MQKIKHLLIPILLALPILLSGQNYFSLTGGVSHSELPIYSQKNNTRLLSSQSSNKLTFSVAYHQRLNNFFTSSTSISYKNIGINTFNQQLDQAKFFFNSVSAEYFTLSYVPKVEIQLGKLTLAAGIGGGVGLKINSKAQNFLLLNNSLDFIDREDTQLKNVDAGVVFNFALKRVIGNGFNVVLMVERYQGLINASTDTDRQSRLYISDSAIRIGMQIPLKKQKS